MPLTNAQVQAIVAEPLWKRVREEDSITQISGTPTVVTRVLVRCLVLSSNAEDLDAVKQYLGTVTEYTNPQTAQGRAQPGVWKNGGHYVEDGAVDLNKPSEKTWNLYQVLYKGTESTLTFVVERTCAMLVEAIKYWGLATLPVLPSVTEGAGITYEMVSYQQDSKTGAWNVIVLKRTRQYQNIGPYDSERTAAVSATEQKQTGVTTQSVPDITAIAQFQAASQDKERNPDCSLNVRTTTETLANQQSKVSSVEAAVTTAATIDTAIDKTTALALVPPTPADGEAKSLRVTLDPKFKDSARVEATTESLTNQQHAFADAEAAIAVAETTDTATDTAALPTNPPVPAQFQSKTLEIIKDPKFKNRARVRQRTETITNQQHKVSDVQADRSVLATIDTAIDKTTALALVPPTPAAGEAKSVRVTLDPKFKDSARVEASTATATKVVPGTATWIDVGGTNGITPHLNLTWTELVAALAAINPAKRADVSVVISREFKERYDLLVRQGDVNQSTTYGDAFATGDIEYTVTSRLGVSTRIGIKWTTSKTAAQSWITATPTGGFTTIMLNVDGVMTFPRPQGKGRFMAVRVWQ